MTLEQVRKWVDAAITDGWEAKPTYANEPIETAVSMTKDSFKVMAIMRPKGPTGMTHMPNRPKDDVSLSAWGPDGMAVSPGFAYSMDNLRAGVHQCHYCRKIGPVKLIGFAGRACDPCYAVKKPIVEYRGWCD